METTTTIDAMAERIEQLERCGRARETSHERLVRQNRRLGRFGVAVVLVGLTSLIAGASRSGELNEVVARRFVLWDGAGNDRMVMTMTSSGTPSVLMMDKARRRRIAMTVDEDGSPGLYLWAEQGKKRMIIAAPQQSESPGILIQDQAEGPRVMLGVAKDGSPDLYLLGKDFKVLFKAPAQ